MNKPILCLDFDGVIHSYTSGWKRADVVSDPPVPGALDFIYKALDHFEIHIFSSRSNQDGGIMAMQTWLRHHALAQFEESMWGREDPMMLWLDCIEWPKEKPPAMITIDDRAITFTGEWPQIETLKKFKPWNKQ